MREGRFSCPGKAVDPENRNGRGYLILELVKLNGFRACESKAVIYGTKNVSSS